MLRFPADNQLQSVELRSVSSSGALVDRLVVGLSAAPCVGSAGMCATSEPLRLVIDEIDKTHPLLSGRALVAEPGGALLVAGHGSQRSWPVHGALPRMRAKLRPFVVRLSPLGAVAVGRDEEHAVQILEQEIARAGQVWGACGIDLEAPAAQVIDPPPPALVSIGCRSGLAASGGELRLVVDERAIRVPMQPGLLPSGVARRLASVLVASGFSAQISDNPRAYAAAAATSDVFVRRKNGEPARVSAPKHGSLSTDATLEVCVGRVELEDGLQHFSDSDAVTGTIEERSLIRGFDDGDPSTIELFVLPSFGQNARIGESFIFSDSGTIKNMMIEDRSGFRAHRGSFTLAHELGHVLLDQPGHSDDYGSDTPTRLMDADAVLPSAFGPRRLTPEECQRAARQTGPESPTGVLSQVPASR